ncbi:MAG: hypothetical protein WCG55_03900 [bacterium]
MTYADHGWKLAEIPQPRKDEVVVMIADAQIAGPVGVLYLHKRYLNKDNYGDLQVDPRVQDTLRMFRGKSHSWLMVVKPTSEYKIQLFGKVFLLKDYESFISEDGIVEIRPFDLRLRINGIQVPTRTGAECVPGHVEWCLSEKVGIKIADPVVSEKLELTTGFYLPNGFRFFNKFAQGFEWADGKRQVFEDNLFIVSAECFFDEEENFHTGCGEFTNWEIQWKETGAGTLGGYKEKELEAIRKKFN